MAHFVQVLSSSGFVNLDTIDGLTILEPSAPGGSFLVVAERHGRPNTILGQKASKHDALAFCRELLGDALHEG